MKPAPKSDLPVEFQNPHTLAKLKPYDQMFVEQLLIHGHPSKAAIAAGMKSSYGIWVLANRPEVAAVYEQLKLDRSRRVNITADMVLTGLYVHLNSLIQMLDCDLSEIMQDDGTVKPTSEWPLIWRTRMVDSLDVEDVFDRSQDGGDKSWDKVGTVKKISRTKTMEIKREIRETWKLIGMHVTVKAFPVPGEKLGEGVQNLADAINAGIAAGRQRAAKRNSLEP